jgi:hypothetical protein
MRTLKPAAGLLRQGHYGRTACGLYPEISRSLLARRTGAHVATISALLAGRTLCGPRLLDRVALLLGITTGELIEDVRGQQRRFLHDNFRVRRAS